MNKKLLFVLINFNFLYSMQPLPLERLAYGYCLQENGKGDKQGQNNSIRWRQEDTVSCVQEADGDLFVSLFDGHGGPAISTFLKNEFYKIFNKTAVIMDNSDIRGRLNSAFKTADEETPYQREDNFDWNSHQGSTALVGYFKKTSFGAYECTIACLGDSRAVVQDKLNNGVLFETVDHTPENESEKKRIEQAGGVITESDGIFRVDTLSTSRAFGNRSLDRKLIIQRPDVTSLTLTAEDGFLIFASDGIWSKISSEDAVKIVADAMTKTSDELDTMYPERPVVTWGGILQGEKDLIEEAGDAYLKRIARVLCYKAREKGSRDNISVIIVNPSNSITSDQAQEFVGVVQPTAGTSDQAQEVVGVVQPTAGKSQSWWSSQTPAVRKYIKGLFAALGLTAMGSYLYYKFYGKN